MRRISDPYFRRCFRRPVREQLQEHFRGSFREHLRERFWGHFWTVTPWLWHRVQPTRPPPSSAFSVRVGESSAGPVHVLGRIRHRNDTRSILIIVHGLGGSSESHYMMSMAAWAERMGLACLRLNMRGAGGDGSDLYHAGLYADVHATLQSPELDRYDRAIIVGYSLGGHIALRYAASGALDPRVRAVAAICAPVDLDRAVTAIDRPKRWLYRRHILTGLKNMYRTAAARRPMPLPCDDALAIDTMREWDSRIMTRHFGYPSAEAYYAAESVAPRLRDISVPALLIAAEADPMVPVDVVRPALEAHPLSPLLDVKLLPVGGHVGFPSELSLGFGPGPGLESQVLHWLEKH
jgi:predicted alpha/beta-fold hydrolase